MMKSARRARARSGRESVGGTSGGRGSDSSEVFSYPAPGRGLRISRAGCYDWEPNRNRIAEEPCHSLSTGKRG